MKSLLPLVLLCFLLHFASAAIHSWKAYYTGTTGMNEFPEFVAVNVLDDEMMGYFDSKTSRFENRQRWMDEKLGEQYVERQTNTLMGHTETFKNNVKIVMQRFNQSQGIHTLQTMYGCELDDDGAKRGYYQYGYDGEDFTALDKDTLTWTAANPQAVITKHKWEADRAFTQGRKNYLENICIEWLRKYVTYGKETLEGKVSPEVSLLQKDSSSPVECHATGFYPRHVMVSWQKNGQDLSEDVDLRETVPNGDGTFQKSSILSVKSEEWKNKPNIYTCVVQHGGRDIIVSLNVKNIKTNSGSSDMSIIIGIVVAAVVLIAAVVVGVFMWKRSKSGYGKTNTSETDSENSDRPMQKA